MYIIMSEYRKILRNHSIVVTQYCSQLEKILMCESICKWNAWQTSSVSDCTNEKRKRYSHRLSSHCRVFHTAFANYNGPMSPLLCYTWKNITVSCVWSCRQQQNLKFLNFTSWVLHSCATQMMYWYGYGY